MLTHEEWVNGAWNKSFLGAPPPANPVRNTKRLRLVAWAKVDARGIKEIIPFGIGRDDHAALPVADDTDFLSAGVKGNYS